MVITTQCAAKNCISRAEPPSSAKKENVLVAGRTGLQNIPYCFPSKAMVLTDEEFQIVSAESHAVIEKAKAAGVYLSAAGIEELAVTNVPADYS